MKHLSSILLSIGVILSVVAIILPQWTVVNVKDQLNQCMANCDDPKQTPAQLKTVCEAACKTAGAVVGPNANAHFGLWEKCTSNSAGNACTSYAGDDHPKDILVSQILSIVGTVALAIGAVMCMMMKPRYSKLAAGLGVACLTAVLIVYGVVTQGQIGRSYTPTSSANNLTTNKVGASYWLELSAAVVGLLGLFVPAAKK